MAENHTNRLWRDSCTILGAAVACQQSPVKAFTIGFDDSDYDETAIAAALDKKQLRDRHPLDEAQYVWIKTQFESQVLGWAGDRVDMANSLEARPPTPTRSSSRR